MDGCVATVVAGAWRVTPRTPRRTTRYFLDDADDHTKSVASVEMPPPLPPVKAFRVFGGPTKKDGSGGGQATIIAILNRHVAALERSRRATVAAAAATGGATTTVAAVDDAADDDDDDDVAAAHEAAVCATAVTADTAAHDARSNRKWASRQGGRFDDDLIEVRACMHACVRARGACVRACVRVLHDEAPKRRSAFARERSEWERERSFGVPDGLVGCRTREQAAAVHMMRDGA